MLFLRLGLGKLLNAIGFPAVIADCEYDAKVCKAKIRIKRGPLFTVTSVNGLDIYFHSFEL